MSMYQYYEFIAIDRPLTQQEQAKVARLSSRVAPHPTTAAFTYSYGDFPGKPLDILANYYDAFFYISNWGSMRLAFRFPAAAVDVRAMRPYELGDYTCINIREKGEYVIVDIQLNDEESHWGWIEGEGNLSGLLPLRNAILQGDYRLLYLAWLMAVSHEWAFGEVDDDWEEAPVPPGLTTLNGSLKNFVDLFQLDQALVGAAAAASPKQTQNTTDWRNVIMQLSESERLQWLERLAANESALSMKFQRSLNDLSSESAVSTMGTSAPRRLVAEIFRQRDIVKEHRKAKAAAAAKKKHIEQMEALALKKDQLWRTVYELIKQMKSKPYDEAAKHLKQLKKLADYQGESAAFDRKVADLREQYPRRSGLLRRLDKL